MQLASMFVSVGSNISGFQRGMDRVNASIDNTTKKATFFSNTLSNAIGTATGIAVTKAVSSLTNLVSSVKEAGMSFNALEESSTLAFETMLKSTQKANKFMTDLKEFARTTPFELPGLIDSSQKLLAFGFAAENILPTLTSIGDAVSGLGGSPEKLNRVIIAIGQIRAKGKIQAEEMLQLTEAGIPAWEILAQKMGKTIPEIMELSRKGALEANEAITNLLSGMDDRFGGLMSKQSKSFSGLKSTIADTFRELSARVMKPWFDNAIKGMQSTLKLVESEKFKIFFEKVVNWSTKAADAVFKLKGQVFNLLSKGFNFVHSFFGSSRDQKQAEKTIDYFRLLSKILGKYENKRFTWLSNFTPKEALTAFLGFINEFKNGGKYLDYWLDHMPKLLQPLAKMTGFFLGLYQVLFNKFDKRMPVEDRFKSLGKAADFILRTIWGLRQFTKYLFEAGYGTKETNEALRIFPKVLQNIIPSLVKVGKSIFEYISGEGVRSTLSKIIKVVVLLGNTLSKLIRPFKEAIGGLFQQIATMRTLGFSDIFKAVLSSIAKAFMGFLKVIKEEFWPTIKSAIVWVWESLTSFISSIDWAKVWNNVVSGFDALVKFVQTIDWGAVWNTIASVFSAIGKFFIDNVLPPLSQFFIWLVSWFSDPTKRNILWSVLVNTWNFVSEWASKIWNFVSPYLTSFFSYLASWFTDPTKRQILWEAIVTTWSFITEWAKAIWDFTSPYLSKFFNFLFSWFTDPTKRASLWNGIVATWDFIIEWSKSLWSWISPYLYSLWKLITAWVTEPSKRTSLWEGIKNTWTAITEWGASLWGWLLPHLTNLWVSLKNWIDTNSPSLGKWTDEFIKFSKDTKDSWQENWPKTIASFMNLVNTIKEETPKIVKAINSIYKAFTGEDIIGEGGMGQFFNDLASQIMDALSQIIKVARITSEMLNEMVQTTKAAFSFDWQGYISHSVAFGDRLSELADELFNYKGFAKGGIVPKTGTYLVGEKGEELVTLPGGSRVTNNSQTKGIMSGLMSKINNQTNNIYNSTAYNNNTPSSSKHDIYIHNESSIPIDRNTVREIAVYLQRELNMQGNRVVFAG